jgi:hypothetical protein
VIAEPLLLQQAGVTSSPREAEEVLRRMLELPADKSAESPVQTSAEALEDNLAILSRWNYGRPRKGEIIMADEAGGWPYRRILRACARVLAAPEDQGGTQPQRA